MVEKLKHNIYHILMKTSCLYFDTKYKCVSFIVHYKGLTLIDFPDICLMGGSRQSVARLILVNTETLVTTCMLCD